MAGTFRKRGCKCPPERKRCNCGAKWYYRYDITDPKTGKRKQKEIGGFTTKEEAEAEAKRIQYELLKGTYIEGKDITFEEFAKEWMEAYEKSGKVKPSTVDIRQKKLKILTANFKLIKLKDVSKLMYQQFLNGLVQRYARKTIASVHEVGRLIFKKAVELEIVAKDITEGIEIPRKLQTVEDLENDREIPKYLERDELVMFLDAIKQAAYNLQCYPLYLTLAYTGLRVGELIALKWKDIDFQSQTISITKTIFRKTNKKDTFELLTPKTKSSRRVIDVDEIVIDELTKLKQLQLEVNPDEIENGFVFADSLGRPAAYDTILNRMVSYIKAAGIPYRLTPHSLRHTHTSLLAEAGVSLEVIQARLGHHSDRITKDIYLHVTKPQKKEASQKFAELMRGR